MVEVYPLVKTDWSREVAFSLDVIKWKWDDVAYYTIKQVDEAIFAILNDLNKLKEAKEIINNLI